MRAHGRRITDEGAGRPEFGERNLFHRGSEPRDAFSAEVRRARAEGSPRRHQVTEFPVAEPFGNVGQYSNPEVDRLFAEGAKAPAEKRQEIYTQVQKIMADELPVLWFLELDFPTVSRCNVKDLVTTSIGINDAAKNAWKQ